MPQLILTKHSISRTVLADQYPLHNLNIRGSAGMNPDVIYAYRPYLISERSTPTHIGMINNLSAPSVGKLITEHALMYGEQNTLAIARVSNSLMDYHIALMGASTTMYANRLSSFAGAVQNYQSALLEYRDAFKAKPHLRSVARKKAQQTFYQLQRGFQNELRAIASRSSTIEAKLLRQSNKGIDMTRAGRNIARFNTVTPVEASALARYAKQAKVLGNGLVAIDFAKRAGDVCNTYQANGEWERALFVESSSFAGNVIAGSAVVKASSVGLTFLLTATPVGWIGLIIGGIAVVGVAATASVGMNAFIKQNSESWYDSILNWVR